MRRRTGIALAALACALAIWFLSPCDQKPLARSDSGGPDGAAAPQPVVDWNFATDPGPRPAADNPPENPRSDPETVAYKSEDAEFVWVAVGRTRDADCDGQPDHCTSWEYDAATGTRVSRTDVDCDGEPERCKTVRYDADGLVAFIKWDTNCDGEGDCARHAYNEDGREVSNIEDLGCDGVDDRCELSEWDEDGNLIQTWEDDFCDGQVEMCTTLHYDDQGRRTDWIDYADCDGAPTTCWYSTYDEETERQTARTDEGCDGTADYRWTALRDESGKIASVVSWDLTDGEKQTFRFDRVRDASGVKTVHWWAGEKDGEEDHRRCVFEENGEGATTYVHWTDKDCDRTWDTCAFHERDAHGNLIRSYKDDGCDRTPDRDCEAVVYERRPRGSYGVFKDRDLRR